MSFQVYWWYTVLESSVVLHRQHYYLSYDCGGLLASPVQDLKREGIPVTRQVVAAMGPDKKKVRD